MNSNNKTEKSKINKGVKEQSGIKIVQNFT